MPSVLTQVRDIAIIVLAVESLIIGLLLILLAIQMRSLAKMLQEEVKPLLDSANETMGTVRGTTSFISDTLVVPVVNAAGFVSAVGKVVRALRGSRGRKRS